MSSFETVAYEPSKQSAFLDLMREVYDGTAWSPQEFDWWFDQNPTGCYLVTLAEEGDATIGAACQSFARVVVDGKQRLATFTVHLMTASAARGKGVFSKLQLHNDARAAEQGAAYALCFPNPQTGPIFVSRLGWEELCRLRLWVRPKRPLRALRRFRGRADSRPRLPRGIERFGPRHEQLYRRAAERWEGHVVKDADYLNWRYLESPRSYAAVETEGGFAVVGQRVYRGLAAGTICELVGDGSVELLRGCVRAVDADVVIAIPNRGEERVYLAAGFVPTPRTIRFVGRSLQPQLEVPRGRDRWRLTLGDIDIF